MYDFDRVCHVSVIETSVELQSMILSMYYKLRDNTNFIRVDDAILFIACHDLLMKKYEDFVTKWSEELQLNRKERSWFRVNLKYIEVVILNHLDWEL